MTHRATLDERQAKRLTDVRGCASKKRYPSKRDVLRIVKTHSFDHGLWFYKCRVCRGFHLTSQLPA